MLENKRNYFWYVVVNLVFGGMVFVISLLSALTGTRAQTGERTLYFDHEMMPDHIFYPLVAVYDQVHLQLSSPVEQILIREELAKRRLGAASELFREGKNELAFVTLGKAHQYLLRVNNDVEHLTEARTMVGEVSALDGEFTREYARLRHYMSDSQQASVTRMSDELATAGGKLP